MPPVAAHYTKKQIKHVSPAQVRYKYKYNSKELQDELGLALKKNICYTKREKFNEIITYIYTSKSCIY
jgi:hypothetical protein